jgi:hypothetical protein
MTSDILKGDAQSKGLQIFNEHAAGVDVGSESMHVSVAGNTPQVYGTAI